MHHFLSQMSNSPSRILAAHTDTLNITKARADIFIKSIIALLFNFQGS